MQKYNITNGADMKIAAIINDLSASQKAFYLIKEFNQLCADARISCTAFVNTCTAFVTRPLFSCMSIAFFSEYNGVAIATTVEEAKSLLETSNNSDKYLYLWDLPWTEQPVNHDEFCKIMRDPRLKIIARSTSHAKVIENFCNKAPVGIVDDWNHRQLLEIVGGDNED